MKDEYIIINKTALLKMREELCKGSPHWDGIYVSSYAMGQIDLIDAVCSQSTPLIPEIEKAWLDGNLGCDRDYLQDYISNLKLNI